jgi:hypothetical protein
MPRRKPDGKGVIVHRIELGNKERAMVEETVDAIKTEQYASAGTKIVNSITDGASAIITPFLQMTTPSAVVFGSIAAMAGAKLLQLVVEDGLEKEDGEFKSSTLSRFWVRYGLGPAIGGPTYIFGLQPEGMKEAQLEGYVLGAANFLNTLASDIDSSLGSDS